MSTSSPLLPSYTDFNNALIKAETPFLAAEVHGYICGLLCATSGKTDNSWTKALQGEKKSRTIRLMLEELYESSFHLISEFSFEFTLLLPSDRADINQRTEALGLWCQGFLTGLKQRNITVETQPPGEVADALNDITEIAQVNHEDLTNNDEDEMAYFEIAEYVRLAVLMIFYELKTGHPQENDLL